MQRLSQRLSPRDYRAIYTNATGMGTYVKFPSTDQIARIELMDENEHEVREGVIKKNISGLGQEIIGEIELIGGILTADPVTQAEGEFNVEVGEIREEIEESVSDDEHSEGGLDTSQGR